MPYPGPRFSALALAVSLAAPLTFTLSACTPRLPPQPPSGTSAASIQELMTSKVDPSADALWAAVSSETTAGGVTEQQPRTGQEWQAVRRHALVLIEAARLLGAPGQAVAKPGKPLEDAHVAGISSGPEIQTHIDATAPLFKARAAELKDSAQAALAAIDARDPARLLAAGGKIDQACERCHMVYWYPNTAQPPARWPAPLKRN
jgi:hypothetical protein